MELKPTCEQEVGVVPNEWEFHELLTEIREMTDFVAAGSFESLRNNVRVFDVPQFSLYVRLFDLRLGLGHNSQKYVDEISYKFLSKSNLFGNEILVANIGANVGEAFLMPTNMGPATIAPNMIVVRANEQKVSCNFLYHYMTSDFGQARMRELIAGSGHPKINKTDLKKLRVSVPPLPEQRAIAAALSDIDALLGALDRLVSKKRDLKQAAIQQLLTGQTRLLAFGEEGEMKPGYKHTEVGVIPRDWDVSSFSDLFSITAGGDVDPERSQSFCDEIHCYPIYSNALTNSGIYGYCSYADHPGGSITITARGMVGGANFRVHPYTAVGRVLVLLPKSEVAGLYFAEVINNHVNFANESTGVPQLTAPQLSKYQIPVPPLTEQHAIAELLFDMDAELSALDKRREKTRALKQGMMQELITGRTRLK